MPASPRRLARSFSDPTTTPAIPQPAAPGNPSPEAEAIWASVLARLFPNVQRSDYDMWLRDTTGVDLQDSILSVHVTSAFTIPWVEKVAKGHLAIALRDIGHPDLAVRFVHPDAPSRLPVTTTPDQHFHPSTREPHLQGLLDLSAPPLPAPSPPDDDGDDVVIETSSSSSKLPIPRAALRANSTRVPPREEAPSEAHALGEYLAQRGVGNAHYLVVKYGVASFRRAIADISSGDQEQIDNWPGLVVATAKFFAGAGAAYLKRAQGIKRTPRRRRKT